MIKTAVARRYARALFELLDQSNIEVTRETLNGLAQSIRDSGDLRHVIASPVFSVEDKIAVLSELSSRFHCPREARAFLGQLVRKNRLGFLPEIAEAFAKLVDESKGTQQVIVSSAIPLSPAEQDRIKTRLRNVLNRDVDLTFHTDAGHLAGIRVQIGSTVVDSTVRGRLKDIRSVLTRE